MMEKVSLGRRNCQKRLINEPSAAALTAHWEDGEERVWLVFDFGGGTLDISIVDCFENIVEITTIAGDNHLGGTDFDREIAFAFCGEKGMDWDKLNRRQQANLLLESKRCHGSSIPVGWDGV